MSDQNQELAPMTNEATKNKAADDVAGQLQRVVMWRRIGNDNPERIEGSTVLGFGNGLIFECKFEDDVWCNIYGEEMTHWMPLPDHPAT